MEKLEILNKRKTKPIIAFLDKQFGVTELPPNLCFLKNHEGRLYLMSKELERIDLSKLRINSIGLYFGTLNNDGIRLSIEGSQLI